MFGRQKITTWNTKLKNMSKMTNLTLFTADTKISLKVSKCVLEIVKYKTDVNKLSCFIGDHFFQAFCG